MEYRGQFAQDSYRLLLFAQGGNYVLLLNSEHGLVLPSLTIPCGQRVAENMTAIVREKWGLETVCLFSFENVENRQSSYRYQILECPCPSRQSTPIREWVHIASLSNRVFADAADFVALHKALSDCLTLTEPSKQRPFAKLGWFRDAQQWVEESTTSFGLDLNGNFRQLNASPSFSLIRFETTQSAVWFKAVGEPNLHEFPIIMELARLFPQYVPPILAMKSEWNAWLAHEVCGANLDDQTAFFPWEQTAEALAKLQIASITESGRLIEAGVKELASFCFLGLVRPFFAAIGELMDQQTKAHPSALSQQELAELAEQTEDAIHSLDGVGVPYALGHLDLNPGNVITAESGPVFLDWAEAYVGNPYLSFQCLIEHFMRNVKTDSRADARLTEAYVAPWRAVMTGEDINKTLAPIPFLAVFVHAISLNGWRCPSELKDTKVAGYLRSLARRMQREARQLKEGTPCLN